MHILLANYAVSVSFIVVVWVFLEVHCPFMEDSAAAGGFSILNSAALADMLPLEPWNKHITIYY